MNIVRKTKVNELAQGWGSSKLLWRLLLPEVVEVKCITELIGSLPREKGGQTFLADMSRTPRICPPR